MKESLDNLQFGESVSVSISDLLTKSSEQSSNAIIEDREAALEAVKKMGSH
jgi:hypothetical protein